MKVRKIGREIYLIEDENGNIVDEIINILVEEVKE